MPLFPLLFTYGNMITQISKVSKHFMIFDVALLTKEAEQDFRMWHLDIERFKLPAQGWTESLWQPHKPEAQEMQKQPYPPRLPFLQELHRVATTDSPLQRNHNSPGVCLWTDTETTETEAYAVGNLSKNVLL